MVVSRVGTFIDGAHEPCVRRKRSRGREGISCISVTAVKNKKKKTTTHYVRVVHENKNVHKNRRAYMSADRARGMEEYNDLLQRNKRAPDPCQLGQKKGRGLR